MTHWFRHAQGRRTVVFATGVRHSVHIRDEFLANGVLAEHIDGEKPKDERTAILAKLSAGEIQVVTNCAVLCEGWDQPEVSCLILARPTKRLGMYIQMVGRVLRTATGKTDDVILDHAGAVHEHGFPEDEITWSLDVDDKVVNEAHAARKADHKRGLTTCPQCTAIRIEGEACRSCGWRSQPKPRFVEVQDGDLGEVQRDRSVHVLDHDELAFYRELKGIFEEKRRRNPSIKTGYPNAKFREKFGRWPPDHWRNVVPLTPSRATLAWVQSREIAWRASQQQRPRLATVTVPGIGR